MTLRMGKVVLAGPLAIALLATTAAAQLAPIEINPGETITGTLDAKDFLFGDGSFYECYVVTGAPGSSVLVTMRSAAFDTYLLAISTAVNHCQDVPADATAVTDDDGGGGANGTDSQVTLTFDANGRFLIAANSYQGGAIGEFALTVEAVAGGGGGIVPPKGPGAVAPPVAPPPAGK